MHNAGSGCTARRTPPRPARSRPAQLWAAVLACGPGSALSHESAAECDGLVEQHDHAPVHVTIQAGRRVARPDGVRLHYLHRLGAARHPTRCPPRLRIEETVLGLTDAAATPQDAVAWVLRACQRRLTTPERLTEAVSDRKKMRWRSAISEALDDALTGAQSLLERRYLWRVERGHGLPVSERQAAAEVDGRRAWRDVRYPRFRSPRPPRSAPAPSSAPRPATRALAPPRTPPAPA